MAELGCSWIFVYLPLGQLGSDTTLGGYCCFSHSVVSDSLQPHELQYFIWGHQ